MSKEISSSYSTKCTLAITPAFKDVMKNAPDIEVVPFACIPLKTIPKDHKTGVLCFVSLLSGRSASQLEPAAEKIVCGSGSAIAVSLLGSNLIQTKTHLRSGNYQDKLEDKKHNCSVWNSCRRLPSSGHPASYGVKSCMARFHEWLHRFDQGYQSSANESLHA